MGRLSTTECTYLPTSRQVPVRVGVLLRRALQAAMHDKEGGYKVLARAQGRGVGSCPLPR